MKMCHSSEQRAYMFPHLIHLRQLRCPRWVYFIVYSNNLCFPPAVSEEQCLYQIYLDELYGGLQKPNEEEKKKYVVWVAVLLLNVFLRNSIFRWSATDVAYVSLVVLTVYKRVLFFCCFFFWGQGWLNDIHTLFHLDWKILLFLNRLADKKATIGYTYEDSTVTEPEPQSDKEEDNSENSESEEDEGIPDIGKDMDLVKMGKKDKLKMDGGGMLPKLNICVSCISECTDVEVDVDELNQEQVLDLNKIATPYGMSEGDFVR